MSSELKITKETLKDIENDNFISTNKDVFLIGHIRSYSNFLELNSKEVIEEFKLQNAYKKIDIKEQIPKPLTYNSFNIKGFLSFASIIFIFAIFYYLFVEPLSCTSRMKLRFFNIFCTIYIRTTLNCITTHLY